MINPADHNVIGGRMAREAEAALSILEFVQCELDDLLQDRFSECTTLKAKLLELALLVCSMRVDGDTLSSMCDALSVE